MTPATRAHAQALAAIHAAAFPPGEQWGEVVMALQLAAPAAFGWIEPAGAMILARTAGDEGEVLTLATAPEARRLGLARGLLRAAMAEAARRGAMSMVLEVAAGNDAAGALYASAGFRAVGRRPRYYAGGDDALIMRAGLNPSG